MIRATLNVPVLIGVALLAGCAGPARSPGPPGSTAILMSNRLGGDCELTWMNTRVDGRALDLSTIAPPGAPPASLARPILAPGLHTVSVAASASCQTKMGEKAANLQVTQEVYMGKDGGQILIAIEREPDSTAVITAKFDVQGGQISAPRSDGENVDCRSRLPMDRAICRTELALARAHANKDVVLTHCISDKLKEMNAVKSTLTPVGVSEGVAQDPAVRGIAEDAEARVVSLANEADLCIGEEMMTDTPGTQVEVPKARKTAVPAFR